MLIFQFTLPREERRQVQAQPLTLQNFNPRSHERSDHITQSFVFRFFNFNPRSHERRDVVEEVAVVGYGDDGSLILLQVLLQPDEPHH